MGFGMEIIFVFMLGLLIWGPKRLHTILLHVARIKGELQNATRGLRSQLEAELDDSRGPGKTGCHHVLVGDCELCSTHESVSEFPEAAEAQNLSHY